MVPHFLLSVLHFRDAVESVGPESNRADSKMMPTSSILVFSNLNRLFLWGVDLCLGIAQKQSGPSGGRHIGNACCGNPVLLEVLLSNTRIP